MCKYFGQPTRTENKYKLFVSIHLQYCDVYTNMCIYVQNGHERCEDTYCSYCLLCLLACLLHVCSTTCSSDKLGDGETISRLLSLYIYVWRYTMFVRLHVAQRIVIVVQHYRPTDRLRLFSAMCTSFIKVYIDQAKAILDGSSSSSASMYASHIHCHPQCPSHISRKRQAYLACVSFFHSFIHLFTHMYRKRFTQRKKVEMEDQCREYTVDGGIRREKYKYKSVSELVGWVDGWMVYTQKIIVYGEVEIVIKLPTCSQKFVLLFACFCLTILLSSLFSFILLYIYIRKQYNIFYMEKLW